MPPGVVATRTPTQRDARPGQRQVGGVVVDRLEVVNLGLAHLEDAPHLRQVGRTAPGRASYLRSTSRCVLAMVLSTPRTDGRPDGRKARHVDGGRSAPSPFHQTPPDLEDETDGHLKRFDHIGVTVRDLDHATEFFVRLGLEVEGRTFVEGDFIDTVIGIPGSRTEIVMLTTPGGGSSIELSRFVLGPTRLSPAAEANEPGLRSVAFEVHDLTGLCPPAGRGRLRAGRWDR